MGRSLARSRGAARLARTVEAIWQFRLELETIAHSHPRGPVAFSSTDRSTMSAVDMALGRAQRYAVVAPVAMIESFDGSRQCRQPRAVVGRASAGGIGNGTSTEHQKGMMKLAILNITLGGESGDVVGDFDSSSGARRPPRRGRGPPKR